MYFVENNNQLSWTYYFSYYFAKKVLHKFVLIETIRIPGAAKNFKRNAIQNKEIII